MTEITTLGAVIKTTYEGEPDTNAFTDDEKTKLAGIEDGATVGTPSAAEIKALYESNADTNPFSDASAAKLGGIEAGATADQTAGEIKALYESNANTNEFNDAEKTKLGTVETGATADQTAAEIAAMSQDWRGTGAETLIAATAALQAGVASGVSDGDKGDVTVSGGGVTWTIDNGVVTLAKMANMATASLIGRKTAGSGVPEVLSAADVREILALPVETVGTATYSFVSADKGKAKRCTAATDGNWTIDAANFAVGDSGEIYVTGAGLPTLVAGGSTTLIARDSALKAAATGAVIGWKVLSATEIHIFGDLTA